MNFTHYTEAPIEFAADLVNTRSRASGTEYLGSVEDLRSFLADHGLMEAAADLDALGGGDLKEFKRLRADLEKVFDATTDEAAVEVVNRMLSRARAVPLVSNHDGGPWHLHYIRRDASPAQEAEAAAAMALAMVICESGIKRLGQCSADDCNDVYVDTSKNSSRRYCTDTCSTRSAVAAYRARRKSPP